MKRSAVARPRLLDRAAAGAVRLDRAEVVAVGERLEPVARGVDHREVVLRVERLDDGRADLPRTDDDDLHAAPEPTPTDTLRRRCVGSSLALVALVAAVLGRRLPRGGQRVAAARGRRTRPLEPRRRRPGTRRAGPAVRRRAARARPRRRAGPRAVRALPRRPVARRLRRRAGPPRSRVLARLRARPDALRQLHGTWRRVDAGRALPRRQRKRAAVERAGDPPRRAAVREPQRRQPRVRARREALGRPRRRRRGRRPREPGAEPATRCSARCSGSTSRQASPSPELVAIGLRNPWRYSFDRATGDLWIGDVGQSEIEEIDRLPRGTTGLVNFGWNVYEGTSRYSDEPLGPGTLLQPVTQYTHDDGLLGHGRLRLPREGCAAPHGALRVRRLLQRHDLEHPGARRRASSRARERRPADVVRREPLRSDPLRRLRGGHGLPLHAVTPVWRTGTSLPSRAAVARSLLRVFALDQRRRAVTPTNTGRRGLAAPPTPPRGIGASGRSRRRRPSAGSGESSSPSPAARRRRSHRSGRCCRPSRS